MTGRECSVVVCTRHRPDLLARCLASLAALEHPSYEVIVVDNTPGEREVQAVTAAAGARYVIEPHAGLSRARNTGARVAQGGIVAYIDDDAIADPSWLTHHAAALQDPRVTATTGRVLPIDVSTPAARHWERFGVDLGETPFRVGRETQDWFERSNFGGVGRGSNMVFRRALFDAGWGFRESLGLGAAIPGGEEHYAFFTLIRAGGTIAYLPDAVVYHGIPATMAAVGRRRKRMLRGAAAYVVVLLVEEPDYRGAALRYARQGTRSERRSWRAGDASMRFASPGQRLGGAFMGLLLYLRSRIPASSRR